MKIKGVRHLRKKSGAFFPLIFNPSDLINKLHYFTLFTYPVKRNSAQRHKVVEPPGEIFSRWSLHAAR
jgi:hypothetical protein